MNKDSMFKTQIAYNNWKKNYQFGSETPIETFKRVAHALAANEKNPEEWEQKFLETMVKFDSNGVPTGLKCTTGGRITANIGTSFEKATLMNCFINGPVKDAKISYKRSNFDKSVVYDINIETLDNPDSLFNIFLTVLEQSKTLASEGGWGMDFSWIRPRGSIIKGTGIQHPGVVSYMHIFDAVAECIVKGNNDGYSDKLKNHIDTIRKNNPEQVEDIEVILKKQTRKGAMLSVLRCDHPDIEEYIRAKQESGKLTKFNMSVGVTDEFMNAVKKNELFPLKFNEKIYKLVDAAKLYELIMRSTYNRGEPGVIFLDNAMKNNPIAYVGKITAANPCVVGETMVMLADGLEISIEEITKKVKNGEKIYVKTFNVTTNDIEIEEIVWCDKTRNETNVIEIELEDGSSITLTPDHKVYTKNRGYIEAAQLTADDIILKFD